MVFVMNKFKIFLIFWCFILLPFTIFFGIGENSQGIRQCTPIKLSYKGWLWKTWEAECVLSGLTEQGANIWYFSICDINEPNNIDIIRNAIEDKQSLTIEYESPLIYYNWNQKTQYCIKGFK